MVRWQTQLQITFTTVILSSKQIDSRINIVLSKFQRLTLNIVPWFLLDIVMVLPTVPARKQNIPISDWEENYHGPNFIRGLKTLCIQSACLTLCHGSITVSGTAEGEGLVGPRPHHFFAPLPPLFENQILWFYSFFRFSIWKNYFQLSALPLFTLLRGLCVSLSPDALYWPLAISVYQSSKENSSHRGIFENIFISFFWGGGERGRDGKAKNAKY